jgi:hypothetical protein
MFPECLELHRHLGLPDWTIRLAHGQIEIHWLETDPTTPSGGATGEEFDSI